MSFPGIEYEIVQGYLFKIYTLSSHFAIDAPLSLFLPCLFIGNIPFSADSFG